MESIVGRGQTNLAILPKLTVTYTDQVFLTRKPIEREVAGL